MSYLEQMDLYRKAYGLEVKGTKKDEEANGADALAGDLYGDINAPVEENPQAPMSLEDEMQVPGQSMLGRDSRFSGDEEADKRAYEDYLNNDPIIQQYGPQMEELLDSIIQQMQDPNDPMTEEEAKQYFAEQMDKNYSQYFD